MIDFKEIDWDLLSKALFDCIQSHVKNEEIYTQVCKVLSVDEEKRTCNVIPVNGNAEIKGVRLQAHISQTDGMVAIPVKDSFVLVTFMSKVTGFVSLFHEIKKYIVKIGDITYELDKDGIRLNGDEHGGILIVQKLVDELNKEKARVDAIIGAITGSAVVAGDGGANYKLNMTSFLSGLLSPTYTNLENEKVKHG